MSTTSIYSSVPRILFDIHRNDFVNQNYQVPVNDGFNMGSEESFYPPSLNEVQAPSFPYTINFQQQNNLPYSQPPQMGSAPTFPMNGVTYNGGMAPIFQPYTGIHYLQTPAPSFTTAPSLASSSSTSLRYPLTPSPIPLLKEVQKASPTKSKSKGKQVTRPAAQTAKVELLIGKPKRKRGPNKRPPGTAFSNLLVGSFRLIPDNCKNVS